MKFLSIILIFLLFTQAACEKPNIGKLPPETQEGLYTFGCKVDGKIYTAEGKGGLLASEQVNFNLGSSDSSISISAASTGNTKNKFHIHLTFKYLDFLGTYMMNIYPYEGTFYDDSNGSLPTGYNTFTTSNIYLGKLNLNYFNGRFNPYYKGSILAGTFEMDAINEEGKVIHITEGRFDIGK